MYFPHICIYTWTTWGFSHSAMFGYPIGDGTVTIAIILQIPHELLVLSLISQICLEKFEEFTNLKYIDIFGWLPDSISHIIPVMSRCEVVVWSIQINPMTSMIDCYISYCITTTPSFILHKSPVIIKSQYVSMHRRSDLFSTYFLLFKCFSMGKKNNHFWWISQTSPMISATSLKRFPSFSRRLL